MSDDSFIGPAEDPDATGHLPVSGEYGSRRHTSDDWLMYDPEDRRDLAPLDADAPDVIDDDTTR